MARKKKLPSSITYKPPGPRSPERWVFRGRAGTDPTTGKPRWHVVTCYDEAEAIEYDAQHSVKSARGSLSGRPPRLTVSQAIEEWADGLGVDPNTRADYVDWLLQPLVAAHGTMPVRQLHRTQLTRLRDQLRAGTCPHPTAGGRKRVPWSADRVNRFLDKIENMLGGLRDEGFLDVNSAALVPRLRERRGTVAQAPKRGVFIENETKTEVSTILQTAAERGIQLFIVCLLAFAGLRKSEIAGLRWDAVDFEAGRMSIWEQRKRNRRKKADRDEGEGTALVTDTKTEESHRELPLPPTLAAALKMVRRWQREMHLASGRRFGVKGEPPTHVVVNPSGGAVHPETVYERWADFVRTLGAAPEGSARTESAKTRADDERPPVIYLHLHAARDTCATLLALRGVLPHLIGAWLGHQPKGMIASPVTGEYIHGDWEFRVMVAEQWELIFGPIVTSCDMDKAMKSGKYQLSA